MILSYWAVPSPILALPDCIKPLILDTDASDTGIGAVLSQVVDGKEQVISYASRTLSNAERKYCVTRHELLAFVIFMQQFWPYLLGRHFKLRTDHGYNSSRIQRVNWPGGWKDFRNSILTLFIVKEANTLTQTHYPDFLATSVVITVRGVRNVNRTLLHMLCTTVQDHNDWENCIRAVCMAYNSSTQTTTGFSPFYLMFGRQPRLPIDH